MPEEPPNVLPGTQAEEPPRTGYVIDADKILPAAHPSLLPRTKESLDVTGVAAANLAGTMALPAAEVVIVDALPTPPTPEPRKATPEEFRKAFNSGLRALYKLTVDEDFQARCKSAGVDPSAFEDPAYWYTLADFSREIMTDRRRRSGDNRADTLPFMALGLMAATPAYIYAEGALDRGKPQTDEELAEKLCIIGNYHTGIGRFVELYPDAKASELTMALFNAANFAIEDTELLLSAARDIGSRIKGIQHETGFWDILLHTGLECQRATAEEDKEGFDYRLKIIHRGIPLVICIDVKASLNEIEALEEEGPIAKSRKGIYLVFSMIAEREFNDGFHIPDNWADTKARKFVEKLLAYLDREYN